MVNSVLMPGGATFFNQSHGYADAGQHIYNIAIEMNERGTYMPIWGTCLGYELLIYLTANGNDLRTDCSSSAQALPLEFETGYKESKLFAQASDEVLHIFSTYNVTANFHIFCFTKEVRTLVATSRCMYVLMCAYMFCFLLIHKAQKLIISVVGDYLQN